MKKYNVTGMSCAACSARVERAVSSVEGVTSCSVNLLTNSMLVEGADDASVIAAVKAAGYGASPVKTDKNATADSGELDGVIREEKRKMIFRLVASLVLLLPLMYLSMGHVMWSAPLPSALAENPVSIALLQAALAALVMVVNQKFFINGFFGAVKGAPNMDTLVALGSGVSYLWSIYVLFTMTAMNGAEAHHALHELYFESAAMILTLITVGKLLEAVAKGRTTDAIKGLVELTPRTAIVVRGGAEIEIPSKEVTRGDVFIVKPGASVPVDGVVLSGESQIDESALTGESMPTEKTVGSTVYAATVNTTGYLRCEATKVGDDTAMAGVVRLVSDAAATKAPIAKVADRVAGIFVPVVLAIAFITTIIWIIVNNSLPIALEHGIAVLVISCPCAMGLATPVAIMVGSGIGAKHGVLFKNAVALEALGEVKTVVLDKTGTLTIGKPTVTQVIPFGMCEGELLSYAYSLESKSEHPLALGIVRYAEERGIESHSVSGFNSISGKGVECVLAGKKLFGVNYTSACELATLPPRAYEIYSEASDEGRTPLYFIYGGELIGIITVSDTLKDDAKESVVELQKLGLRTVMLTGDNERTARAVASSLGGCEVIAGVLPDGKEKVVRSLMRDGRVAMVGDGINDAPALVSADVGIAIGRGADIAIDAADVVLMHSTLSELVGAVRLSRATLAVVKENLFWAFIYNVIGIPLAAGAFSSLLGWTLTPMFGAAAMSISSFIVVMNALRLNLKRIFWKTDNKDCKTYEKYEKTNNLTVKEQNKMEKTFRVEGMMCPHCEAHVVKAVKEIPGVLDATASHKDKRVTVTLSDAISDEAIIEAITAAGYSVA